MKNRNIEKTLYKIAALLAIVGIVLWAVQPADNYLGLYFILGGHILGVAGILLYMKHSNEMDQAQETVQKPVRQLEKN